MDKFDNTNIIPISYIDYSTTPLNYVDSGITQNISTSLSSINNSISSLQTSDQSQTTSINNFTTSINNLTNNKQDLLSNTNLLNSSYVSYNASDVKSTLDNISTSLSGKADSTSLSLYAPINNPTFSGTVSGITKSMVGLTNVDNTSDLNKPISTATQTALDLKANTSSLSSYAPLANPIFSGTVSGITKAMVNLGNCDNTSDLNKPISTSTQSALDLKANTSSLSSYATLSAPVFTNFIQTPRIFENIQSTYTSFTSNVLTFDYANGSILYFNGLTTSTNFTLVLNNMNPNSQTNRSFTFSLIIDVGTQKAFANAFRLGATTYTLIASGGLSNVSVANVTTSGSIIQVFTVIFTSSATVPYKIFTSVNSYY